MLLAVDASALVAEALRARDRDLLNHPDLDLVITDRALDETHHELQRRIEQIGLHSDLDTRQLERLLQLATHTIAARVRLVPAESYVERMQEATRRIPRDARDASTIGLALELECGIWTADRDFFGCGVPVWATDTLLLHLQTNNSRSQP